MSLADLQWLSFSVAARPAEASGNCQQVRIGTLAPPVNIGYLIMGGLLPVNGK